MTELEFDESAILEAQRPEAHRYRNLLRVAIRAVLLLLIAGYAVYLSGLLAPTVPLDRLSEVWDLPARDYVARTGVPTGWRWVTELGRGDVLTMVPAALLTAITGICLVSILPLYMRRREWTFVVILVLQLAVLVIAAVP